MDFSSGEKALESILRRRPALSPSTLALATSLLGLYPSRPALPSIQNEEYTSAVLKLLKEDRWEPLAVGLYLSDELLLQGSGVYVEGPRVPTLISDAAAAPSAVDMDVDKVVRFSALLLQQCRAHLEHSEPRVRTLVAKFVGSHAKLSSMSEALEEQGAEMYRHVLDSLFSHLKAGRDLTDRNSKDSNGALDDTTGWRALETDLQAIASFVHGKGALYFSTIQRAADWLDNPTDDELLQALKHCCVVHVNRHVRAAGIAVLEQMVHATVANASSHTQELLLRGQLKHTITEVLKHTLADNWSQVRMAASILCRVYCLAILSNGTDERKEEALNSLYPTLLPRMCLNRFYLAQGVKLYSHDTWKLLFETTSGVEAVAANVGPVCRYYVAMCDADNHVVREAACQAVAELALKLGQHERFAEYLAPFVPSLLQALLMCFHDESWPVRDEACLACGTFCLAYPEECKPELSTLFSRWTEQLTDQIWSVREDAAVALGDAILAYGPEILDKVMGVLKSLLPSARDQAPMTREEYKQRQNDIDSHTNTQLYSCGSLAPKLRKGGAGRIGCSDCEISRPKSPWESTDGCIYLIRELCVRFVSNDAPDELVLTDDTLVPLLTELADVCRVNHFPQADTLRTTLWKQLPVMADALGKQRFKRKYLQLFLDLLLSNMDEGRSGSSQLAVHAAGQCAEELSALVGVGIFKGRLEEDWQKDLFDRVMEERKNTVGPGNNMCANEPSPFGPPDLITRGRGDGGGGISGGRRGGAGNITILTAS